MLWNSLLGALAAEQVRLSLAQQASLTDAERGCLQSFVARVGDLIADDMTPFTNAEHKRLTFLHWLYTNGKLPD
jgi:hypothetical protein